MGRFNATKDGMELEVIGPKRIKISLDGVEIAKTKPTTKERIIEALSKTKETPFFFKNIEVEIEDNLMIPISKLNEIRRRAIEKLLDELQEKREDIKVNINFEKGKR
ncbi:DUF3656 domain-containing protein [Caloramator sp. Dgby_cultured_2]|nr:DUF3656 domain-containing protein [Caloramator sp. Dgby_cultured_2]WDU84545.1 DUF3656 domain-containing protein [Caloramator sp. Dgby_cultured_2]